MALGNVVIVGPADSARARGFSAACVALGASPLHVSAARDALTIIGVGRPDLLAVDLVVGEFEPAIDLITQVRQSSTIPIMVLADPNFGQEVAVAFTAGADDFLTNLVLPASDLGERIVALQRRVAGLQAAESHTVRVRDLEVDLSRHQVTLAGNPVMLTPIEFRLLATLATNVGRVVSPQELVAKAQGYQVSDAQARPLIKAHMHRLRNKLEPWTKPPPYVAAIPGVGYTLEHRPDGSGGDRRNDPQFFAVAQD